MKPDSVLVVLLLAIDLVSALTKETTTVIDEAPSTTIHDVRGRLVLPVDRIEEDRSWFGASNRWLSDLYHKTLLSREEQKRALVNKMALMEQGHVVGSEEAFKKLFDPIKVRKKKSSGHEKIIVAFLSSVRYEVWSEHVNRIFHEEMADRDMLRVLLKLSNENSVREIIRVGKSYSRSKLVQQHARKLEQAWKTKK
ncbi:hypothetical protein PsorP6_019544 [Peronosclerospora sorghi]|nr:hypothetical protein PsorP6_019544 [Peronosclerospora sorghi]